MPDKLSAAARWATANWRLLATVVSTIALTFGVTVLVSDGNGDGKPDTIIIHKQVQAAPPATAIDGPDADTKRDDALPLSATAQKVVEKAAATPERYDLAGNMRGHDATRAGVIRGPLASQEWPGCKTAFVKAFSQRTTAVRAIELHYTAGLNVAGWGDLDGLTAFSNNVRNQVSWHFAIDREGHCTYNVPVTQKAWTISALNSATVNLEIVGTGKEPDYAGTAGMKRVSAVVRRIAKLYDVPLRLGATDGQCHVTKSGIMTHWMGGPCSGGHIDIKPYKVETVIAQIAADAAATARPHVTSSDRTDCKAVHAYRLRRRAHKPKTAGGTAAFNRRLARVEAHGVKCVDGRAVLR